MEELKKLLIKLKVCIIEISDKEIFIPCPVDKYIIPQPLSSFYCWLKSDNAVVVNDCSAGIHIIECDGELSFSVVVNENY